jgi:hypothetical protein
MKYDKFIKTIEKNIIFNMWFFGVVEITLVVLSFVFNNWFSYILRGLAAFYFFCINLVAMTDAFYKKTTRRGFTSVIYLLIIFVLIIILIYFCVRFIILK